MSIKYADILYAYATFVLSDLLQCTRYNVPLRVPPRLSQRIPLPSLVITVILEEKIPATTSSWDDHTQGMATSSTLGLTARAGGEGGGGRRGAKRSRPPAPPHSERNFCSLLHISGNGRRPLGVSNILGPVYSTDSSPVEAAPTAAAVHTPASSQKSLASKPRRGDVAASCARPRTSCARAAAIALLLAATLGLSTAAAAAAVGGSEIGTAATGATTSSRLCSPADDSRAYVTTIAPDDINGDHDLGDGDDDASLPRASVGGGEGSEGQGGGVMGARVLAQWLRSAGAKGAVGVLVPLERASEANLEALRRDGLKVQVVPRAPQQQSGERAYKHERE